MANITGTAITNRFGQVQGFADFEFAWLNGDIIGIRELSYESEMEMEAAYGKGRMPVGVGVGNYKATASMTIIWEEWQRVLANVPPSTTVHDFQFDINVTYDTGGVAMSDAIRNCRIMKASKQTAQGDKDTTVQIDLFTTHIDEGVNI